MRYRAAFAGYEFSRYQSTKLTAIPPELVVTEGTVMPAIDIHRRLTSTNIHIDFVRIATPNLTILTAILCKEYTMKTTL